MKLANPNVEVLHPKKRMKLIKSLDRGDMVIALRDLTHSGIPAGTIGVVFEHSNYYEDEGGPMVRFFNGHCCSVYEEDVEYVKSYGGWQKKIYRSQRNSFLMTKITQLTQILMEKIIKNED